MVAVGFGTGWSPIMPGTVGTLLGLPLAWGLMQMHPGGIAQLIVALLLTLLAIPICEIAEK